MISDPRRLKRALRRQIVARILAMDPGERRRQEAELFGLFHDLPGLAGAQTVLLYASAFPEEFDTEPYLAALIRSGRVAVCPRVDRLENRLRLYSIADPAADFRAGVLGIPEPDPSRPEIEPEAIDWALVPGIAFDSNRYRLGRGGGHYDRLLPRLRPEIGRWALAFRSQFVESLPVEPHDQPLSGVVYPSSLSSAV